MRIENEQLQTSSHQYYYVVAKWCNKTIVRGPYLTEEQAYEKGFQDFDCSFDITKLGTKDIGAARGIIRDKILSETHSVGEALQRQMHKPPQQYKKRWWKESEK